MYKFAVLCVAQVLLWVPGAVVSQEAAGDTKVYLAETRQFVEMPEQAQKLMQDDMLDHLAALSEIMGLMAANKLDAAAEVAETRMGKSSMGKHRETGMGPGRFMPLEMRQIGWGMHEAASEFAVVAKQGDVTKAYSALQTVMSSCVACHYSYRTR